MARCLAGQNPFVSTGCFVAGDKVGSPSYYIIILDSCPHLERKKLFVADYNPLPISSEYSREKALHLLIMSIPVIMYGVASKMGAAVAPLLGPRYEGR